MKEESRKRKAAWDIAYAREHIRRLFVPFNDNNPEDVRMLRWLDGQPNKTRYVKDLIQRDMPGG